MKKFLLFFLTPIAAVLAQNLQISGGNAHSVAICESGDIYAWGKNDVGQLGPNTVNSAGGPVNALSNPTPVLVTGFPAGLDIKQTDAGSGSHTLALGCDTKVYAWGTNGSGQLGNGTTATSQATPVAVKGVGCVGDLTGVTYVSGGNDESFAIMADKRIVAWGQNDAGQLGDGTTMDRLCPVYVKRCAANGGGDLMNVVQVEAGDENCYALLADGSVWSWGMNVAGNGLALGRGTAGTSTIATNNTCAAPMQYANPANIANFSANTVTNIKSISAGDRHLLLLDNNGYVWSTGGDWGGAGGAGQIGTGAGYQSPAGVARVLAPGDPRCTTDNNNSNQAVMTNANFFGNVISISGLQASSIAVTADGRAWAWGGDGFFDGCPTGGGSVASGHLGIGGLQTGTTCVAEVGRGCPTEVTTAGGAPLTGIASVSDGDAVSFFIGEDGTVYTAGSGRYGQVGSATNQTRAVSLPSLNSLPCNVAIPVAPKPNLGADFSKCPAIKARLNAQVTQLTPYNFIWEYSSTGTAPWTVVEAFDGPGSSIPTGQNADTIYVRNSGFYRLIITDDRNALAANCAPPGIVGDTVQVLDLLPPAGTLQAGTCGTDVCFQVDTSTTPGALDPTLFDWYKDVMGGSKLNTNPSANPFCVPMASLNPPVGGVYTIYAEDKRRFDERLYPAAAPCASSASDNIDKYYNEVVVYQDVKDITLQFYYVANGTNATTPPITVEVYANDPTKNSNTGGPVNTASSGFTSSILSPVGLTNSTTPQLVTMSLAGTLTGSAGGTTYWIRLSGGDKSIVYPSSCKTTPYISDLNGVTVLSSSRVAEYGNINNPQPYGSIFNLNYTTGSSYTCGRFPLKATGVTACLPVHYLSFTGEALQNNVKLSWSVSYENDVKYYSILRSSNGIDFIEIGQQSTQRKSGLNTYNYTDVLENVHNGKFYYKILEMSNYGQSSTKVIAVNLKQRSSALIAPNPNTGSFKISLEDEVEHIGIEVFDLSGRLVYTQSGSGNVVNVNLGATAKGVYLVYVSNGTDKWVEKVVVE